MERRTDIKKAKKLFGENFVGPEEIELISSKFNLLLPSEIPRINYKQAELEKHARDSILILGIEKMKDGSNVNLLKLREIFGTNPLLSEPCFYNQDWYLKENFVKSSLLNRWYLLKKNLFEDSRAVVPELLDEKYIFPSAILCAYTFFVYYFLRNNILWKYDYVWCRDIDHNGDRIYVGKYTDIDAINKSGFSIHRHLTLKNSYGAITVYSPSYE